MRSGERAARAEADRRSSREAKRRRTGTCEDCGGVTRYGGAKGRPVSRLCAICSAKRNAAARRGTGTTQKRALDFIGDGERRFMEIVNGCEITPDIGKSLMHRLLKYGLVERPRRGVYRRSPDA